MDIVNVEDDTYGVIADTDEVIVSVDNASIEVTTKKADVDADLKPLARNPLGAPLPLLSEPMPCMTMTAWSLPPWSWVRVPVSLRTWLT